MFAHFDDRVDMSRRSSEVVPEHTEFEARSDLLPSFKCRPHGGVEPDRTRIGQDQHSIVVASRPVYRVIPQLLTEPMTDQIGSHEHPYKLDVTVSILELIERDNFGFALKHEHGMGLWPVLRREALDQTLVRLWVMNVVSPVSDTCERHFIQDVAVLSLPTTEHKLPARNRLIADSHIRLGVAE
jgi:hypothetical protein